MNRRNALIFGTSILGVFGSILGAIPFIKSMLPSERTKTLGASVRVKLGSIKPGEQQTVQWRGKPIWILRRTEEMTAILDKVIDELRDPNSDVTSQQPDYAKNSSRSIKPEYFICIGLCTHLGCVPKFRPEEAPDDLGEDWHGGYFCPCHGSRFDLAGRVFKGVPAPTNLVIPPHYYEGGKTVVIGEDLV